MREKKEKKKTFQAIQNLEPGNKQEAQMGTHACTYFNPKRKEKKLNHLKF